MDKQSPSKTLDAGSNPAGNFDGVSPSGKAQDFDSCITSSNLVSPAHGFANDSCKDSFLPIAECC